MDPQLPTTIRLQRPPCHATKKKTWTALLNSWRKWQYEIHNYWVPDRLQTYCRDIHVERCASRYCLEIWASRGYCLEICVEIFASSDSHRDMFLKLCASGGFRCEICVEIFASRYLSRYLRRYFPSWNLRRDISFGRIASIYSLKIFASRGDRCEICLERSASRDSRRHMFSRFVASTGDLRREISIEIFSARIAWTQLARDPRLAALGRRRWRRGVGGWPSPRHRRPRNLWENKRHVGTGSQRENIANNFFHCFMFSW